MAGVIDSDGQQWERCHGCGEFVTIESLLYEEPSLAHQYGRDLCPKCAGPNDKPGKTFTIRLS